MDDEAPHMRVHLMMLPFLLPYLVEETQQLLNHDDPIVKQSAGNLLSYLPIVYDIMSDEGMSFTDDTIILALGLLKLHEMEYIYLRKHTKGICDFIQILLNFSIPSSKKVLERQTQIPILKGFLQSLKINIRIHFMFPCIGI